MDARSTFYNVRVRISHNKRLPVYKDIRDSEPGDTLRSAPNDILPARLTENGWIEFLDKDESFWLPMSGNSARYSLEQAWDNEVVNVEILAGGVWRTIDCWSETKQVDL